MRIELQILAIAIGGALGSVTRFSCYLLCEKIIRLDFPWGTLLANGAGCLFAGLLVGSGLAEKYPSIRAGLVVGFLGGMTTFSTFSVETVHHIRQNEWALAFSNILANLAVGLAMVFVGAWLGKKLFG